MPEKSPQENIVDQIQTIEEALKMIEELREVVDAANEELKVPFKVMGEVIVNKRRPATDLIGAIKIRFNLPIRVPARADEVIWDFLEWAKKDDVPLEIVYRGILAVIRDAEEREYDLLDEIRKIKLSAL